MTHELRELLANVVALLDTIDTMLANNILDTASVDSVREDIRILRELAHRTIGRLDSDSN